MTTNSLTPKKYWIGWEPVGKLAHGYFVSSGHLIYSTMKLKPLNSTSAFRDVGYSLHFEREWRPHSRKICSRRATNFSHGEGQVKSSISKTSLALSMTKSFESSPPSSQYKWGPNWADIPIPKFQIPIRSDPIWCFLIFVVDNYYVIQAEYMFVNITKPLQASCWFDFELKK